MYLDRNRIRWVKSLSTNQIPDSCHFLHDLHLFRRVDLSKYDRLIFQFPYLSSYDLQQIAMIKIDSVALAGDLSIDELRDLMQLGFKTIYHMQHDKAKLVQAASSCNIELAYLSPYYIHQLALYFTGGQHVDFKDLPERSAAVARLLTEGHTYKEIACKLCISLETVRDHVKKIYRTFDVHSSHELRQLLQPVASATS